MSGQYDGSGSDGVGLEFNTNAEKSSIESYVRLGAGAGDNEGVVGAKPLTFTASKFDFRDGNVGIGTDAPEVSLHVKGANDTTFTDSNVTLIVEGTDAFDSGKAGSRISFLGKFDEVSPATAFGQIYTRKENLISGQYDASMCFGTRKVGDFDDTLIERMRITSTGNVGIGVQNPTHPLTLITAGGSNAGGGLRLVGKLEQRQSYPI